MFELFRTVRSTKNHRFSHWKTPNFVPFHPIPRPVAQPRPAAPVADLCDGAGTAARHAGALHLAAGDAAGSPALLMTSSGITWRLIPLSKWVITPVINGISRVNPLITGVITHLRAVGWATFQYPIYWGLFHNPRTGNPHKPTRIFHGMIEGFWTLLWWWVRHFLLRVLA